MAASDDQQQPSPMVLPSAAIKALAGECESPENRVMMEGAELLEDDEEAEYFCIKCRE